MKKILLILLFAINSLFGAIYTPTHLSQQYIDAYATRDYSYLSVDLKNYVEDPNVLNYYSTLANVRADFPDAVASRTDLTVSYFDYTDSLNTNYDSKYLTITPSIIKNDITVIYIHGGAFVGGAYGGREIINIVDMLGAKLYSIHYKLAPTFDYRESIESAASMIDGIINNNNLDRSKVILMGQSAGGGLALSVYQKLRADNKPANFKGLWLISPWADVSNLGSSKHSEWDKTDPIIDWNGKLDVMQFNWVNGMNPNSDGDANKASGIYGSFINGIDTYITSGTKETLQSDSLRLYRKLKDSKVRAKLYMKDGVHHDSFFLMDSPETIQMYETGKKFFNLI